MESEKNLFVDDLGRQWKMGKLGNISSKPNHDHFYYYIIELPCYAYSMFPETEITEADLCFCQCLQCFSSLEKGNVCITVKDDDWRVGLKCEDCTELSTNKCKIFITHVLSAIEPIITKGAQIINHQCLVCERTRCNDPECMNGISLLYENDTEKLFEHFYLINLNILKPLLGKKFKDVFIWRNYSKCFRQK
jgi:hypothetical protein